MSKRLSDLDPIVASDLEADDLFEILDKSENKSCSTSLRDISTYSKTSGNGGFMGLASLADIDDLDAFTYEHCGVWRYDGVCEEIGLTSNTGALVEIVSYSRVDAGDKEPPDCIFQRVTYNVNVYQRFKIHDTWLNWNCLSNRNRNAIDYGSVDISATDEPTEGKVTFTAGCFTGLKTNAVAPSVTCSVIAPPTSTAVYNVVITSCDYEGFTYIVYASDRQAAYEESIEKVETSDVDGGTMTYKTTTVSNVYGAWTGPKENVTLNFLATMTFEV